MNCCHIGFGSIILTNSSKVCNQAKKILLTLHFLRLGAVSSVKDIACAFFPRTPFPLLFTKRLRYCPNRNFLCPTILPHTLCPKTQKYNLQVFQCLHRLYFAERWSCPVLHAKTRPRFAVGQLLYSSIFHYADWTHAQVGTILCQKQLDFRLKTAIFCSFSPFSENVYHNYPNHIPTSFLFFSAFLRIFCRTEYTVLIFHDL